LHVYVLHFYSLNYRTSGKKKRNKPRATRFILGTLTPAAARAQQISPAIFKIVPNIFPPLNEKGEMLERKVRYNNPAGDPVL
jgi:hypothetical protein